MEINSMWHVSRCPGSRLAQHYRVLLSCCVIANPLRNQYVTLTRHSLYFCHVVLPLSSLFRRLAAGMTVFILMKVVNMTTVYKVKMLPLFSTPPRTKQKRFLHQVWVSTWCIHFKQGVLKSFKLAATLKIWVSSNYFFCHVYAVC